MWPFAFWIGARESFGKEFHTQMLGNTAASFFGSHSNLVKEVGLGIGSGGVKLKGSQRL